MTAAHSVFASSVFRYSLSTVAGVVMTAAIFLLMYRLIGSGPLKVKPDEAFAVVNIYQPPVDTAIKPRVQAPEPEKAPLLEPSLAPLSVNAPTATSQTLNLPGPPIASFAPGLNDIAVSSGEGGILGSGIGNGDTPQTWTPPGDDKLAKKIAAADAKGANGYKEVLPNATRQPNIPEYAWKNKINGWVLVAFTVNAKGFVENVRVLDAQPRGVFEENVIESVKHWVYSPADFGGKAVKAQLTQKIELFYKDYPNNNKQLQ